MRPARSHVGAPTKRRGRPLKFGRRARAVVLTLPEDVLTWLTSLHRDPAWAIVSVFERTHGGTRRSKSPVPDAPAAELVSLPGGRGLIVVEPRLLRRLPGVSLVPLPDGRAFLALEPLKGMADLEIAVSDRLEATGLRSAERKALTNFLRQLREWRRTEHLRFSSRSIILAEQVRSRASAANGGDHRSTRRHRS